MSYEHKWINYSCLVIKTRKCQFFIRFLDVHQMNNVTCFLVMLPKNPKTALRVEFSIDTSI